MLRKRFDMANAEDSCVPAKRRRLDCVIHCSPNDETESKLISPQNINSWKTLITAAEIRNHTPILELAKKLSDGEVPDVKYHRKCRSIFTMKKDLERLIATRNTIEKSDKDDFDKSCTGKRKQGSKSRIYEKEC